jgi:hypothetical protein
MSNHPADSLSKGLDNDDFRHGPAGLCASEHCVACTPVVGPTKSGQPRQPTPPRLFRSRRQVAQRDRRRSGSHDQSSGGSTQGRRESCRCSRARLLWDSRARTSPSGPPTAPLSLAGLGPPCYLVDTAGLLSGGLRCRLAGYVLWPAGGLESPGIVVGSPNALVLSREPAARLLPLPYRGTTPGRSVSCAGELWPDAPYIGLSMAYLPRGR